jgi:hypothetical protein
LFCKQLSEDILEDASGSSASDATDARKRGSIEVWGWGCNARGQLGPLAPSGSVVLQPQRLHALPAGALLDSIGAGVVFCGNRIACCALFERNSCAVAGMHHTAIFTREVKAGGLSASQKGMDVIRCFAPIPRHHLPFCSRMQSDVTECCRQNGGWVKIYRTSAAAAQLQVQLSAVAYRLFCETRVLAHSFTSVALYMFSESCVEGDVVWHGRVCCPVHDRHRCHHRKGSARFHARVVGCFFSGQRDACFRQPVERVRFVWGRMHVALAGCTAAVVAVAAGGTKTLVLSCKEEE